MANVSIKVNSLERGILPPLPDSLSDHDDGPGKTPELPLPQRVPIEPNLPVRFQSVRCGCWLLNYTPTGSDLLKYDGTLRVECHSVGRTASGDLYQRRALVVGIDPREPLLYSGPNPAKGIPILSLRQYRYYLRVTKIAERLVLNNRFQLGFEMWRFTEPNSWANQGAFTAEMTWIAAPSGYPSASDYLEGDVRNAAGAVVGRLKMGWLTPFFRKATVEIDTVAGCERPLDNGQGVAWKTVFDPLGWDVAIRLSDTNVAESSGDGWSDAEMHAAMLARRDRVSLDTEWRYHILSVKLIDSTPRGIMYDAGGSDSNNVPREGVGIATNWTIPNTAAWGLVAGQRFGAAPAPFFRTAVHELGHAMGLFHNTVDNGFMNTTDVIAASATATVPFPNNIKWDYADDDLKRLRHYPDVFVRPGGSAFGTASTTTPPISPTDLEVEIPGLALRVTALLAEVPLGAPVRVLVELTNTGDMVQHVPADLSLKTEFVSGTVVDPGGAVRSFSTVIHCIEDKPMRDLAPGESIANALTLLRGGEGALFPVPGVHAIGVEVRWDIGTLEAVVSGATTVMVTGVVDAAHAAAAHGVLATPDAHLVLVLGGDHLTEGVEAVKKAVADPVLHPHYASVEAKRLAQPFRRRKADIKAASDLVSGTTVMSGAEIGKLARLVTAAGGQSGTAALKKTLKAKAQSVEVSGEARSSLDAL